MDQATKSRILALWRDPTTENSFSNIDYFMKTLRKLGIHVKRAELSKILELDPDYALTRKNPPQKIPRRSASSLYFGERFEADLAFVGDRKLRSSHFRHRRLNHPVVWLQVIDTFSRFIWARKLRNKEKVGVSNALGEIFASMRPPYAPLNPPQGLYRVLEGDQEFNFAAIIQPAERLGVRIKIAYGDNKVGR